MKQGDKQFIFLCSLIGIVIIFISLDIYYLKNVDIANETPNQDIISEQQIVDLCNKSTMIASAECTNKIINIIYKYNNTLTPVGLDTILKSGGDCQDYALLYERIGTKLGYYTYDTIIRTNETGLHDYATWSYNHTYCILDQRYNWCVTLG